MLASVLNYLCQLLLARVLTVESFGTINAIFSFMLIATVPGTTLTMIVSKYYASADENVGLDERQAYLQKALRGISLLAAIAFFMFILLRTPLRHLLAIEDTLVLILAFSLASIGLYQPFYSGVFSGNRHFVWVGLYSMFIPLYKVASVATAHIMTKNDVHRLYIVLAMMTIGTIVTALVGHWKSVSILGGITFFRKVQIAHLFGKDDLNTMIINICLMVYMNIDLLSIRYHEQNNESGLYSAVLLFGRIIYYFSTTLGTILLPTVADRTMSEKGKLKILNRTLLVLMAFSFLCMAPINIGKEFLIRLLYGTEYVAAACYVKNISMISLALSLCTILVNYLVGVGRTRFAVYVMLTIDIILVLCNAILKNIDCILNGISITGLVGALVIYWFGIKTSHKKVIDNI